MLPPSSGTSPRPQGYRKGEEVNNYFAMNTRVVQCGYVFGSLYKCESCTVVNHFPSDEKKGEAVVFRRPSCPRRSGGPGLDPGYEFSRVAVDVGEETFRSQSAS